MYKDDSAIFAIQFDYCLEYIAVCWKFITWQIYLHTDEAFDLNACEFKNQFYKCNWCPIYRYKVHTEIDYCTM